MHLLIVSGPTSTFQNSIALATASHAAARGMRVLLVGSGPAGLLAHLCGSQAIATFPQRLSDNLDAMELVALDEFGRGWETLESDPTLNIPSRLRRLGKDELPAFPGMDEVGAMVAFDRAARSGSYDLVVSGGPTIDSLLRGLSIRDTVRWLVRLVAGLDRGPGKSFSSQEAALIPLSVFSASASSLLQDLRVQLERYGTWFEAGTGTRVRLAMPAEEMLLPVLRHTLGGLGLYGLAVDTLFVRGSDPARDPLDTIDPAVRQVSGARLVPVGLPLTPASLEDWAVRGAAIYKDAPDGVGLPEQETPTEIPPPLVERREVRLHIPFLNSKALSIGIAREEVIVRMGQFRRHLLIAGVERGGNLRARAEGETLHVWVEEC